MSNMTTTTNGALAVKSTYNHTLDLFGTIVAARDGDPTTAFRLAMGESVDLAIRVLLWCRDVRGGAGERATFRNLLKYLVNTTDTDTVIRVLRKVPGIGRWDDLFAVICLGNSVVDNTVVEMCAKALIDGNGLCAKWMPREGKPYSQFFRTAFGLSPRDYRKMLVKLSNTVEQKMCAKEWDSIEFGKIPSIAARNYQDAFKRNAPNAYAVYLEGLDSGKETVNAGAIFPYDVIRGLSKGHTLPNAQWKALPNYMEGFTGNILPIIDVSPSMNELISRKSTLSCKEVAVSLGLYVSERMKGHFKNTFITFSDKPSLVQLTPSDDLLTKVNKINASNWGSSTNIIKTFELILDSAVSKKLPANQMPDKILLISDMQFDNIAISSWNTGELPPINKTTFDMIEDMYVAAGYKRPDIIFWQLNSSSGFPVTFNVGGTAIVSGFSPAIMKSVLRADLDSIEAITPLSVMLSTINVPRYDW